MDCNRFQSYLRECVERHRTPDVEPYAVHLEVCPACQQEWIHWQVLERAISEWNDLGETPDLSSRVLSELVDGAPQRADAPSERPTRRATSHWMMAATATALLLVIVPLVLSFLMRQNDPNIVKNDPKDNSLQPVGPLIVEEPSLEALVGRTRSAYSSLLNEAGIRSQSSFIVKPPTPPVPGTGGPDSNDPTSLGLLTRDLQDSVGFLGRLLPSLEPNP